MLGSIDDRVIVALDCDRDEALALASDLVGHVEWVKVGMTLFYEAGPGVVKRLRDLGFSVFVDLKLHDIPHQVSGAAERLGRLGAKMITVHASGGAAMVRAAVDGAREGAAQMGFDAPAVLAITVLTSTDESTLRASGVDSTPAEQVERLATLARDAGADGVVCSPQEAARMRGLLGESALVVTPGVRPEWAAKGDQARVATPAGAIAAGASHLVVGRPITGAEDPVAAADRIVAELAGARA
jgi:orotidine-5'-phosphate decarboxylase